MGKEPRGINRRNEFEVTDSLASRFWQRVKKVEGNGCWEWQGAFRNSYGAIKHQGSVLSAHRVAYVLTNGHPPQGMLICHTCDNRACCRPDHLEVGTPGKNNNDARKRRTFFKVQGENAPNASMTERDIRQIMQLRSEGLGARLISRQTGLKENNVKKVLEGESWTHITGGKLVAGNPAVQGITQ